jgi:hypothetical protein
MERVLLQYYFGQRGLGVLERSMRWFGGVSLKFGE